jgi:predicted XRE-type DNA-binding protein
MTMIEPHLGSTLDEFLEDEGLLAQAEAVAVKRALAYQMAQLMEQQRLSKAELARRMNTSRAAVDRLLDPEVGSATLTTLEKAALALGVRLQVSLV